MVDKFALLCDNKNMKKIKELFTANRPAIIWSICYIIITWLILQLMFNFSIFSATDWIRLSHARLHGFAGFVFGILILAAVPLYIATTTIIVRTKKPLLTISVPAKIKPIVDKVKDFIKRLTADNNEATSHPETDATPDTAPTQSSDTDATAPLPNNLPNELKASFLRARARLSLQSKIDNSTTQTKIPTPAPQANTGMETRPTDTTTADNPFPIPDDFDFQMDAPSDQSIITEAPVFTSIDFDTSSEIKEDTSIATNPPPVPDATANNPVMEYMQSKSIKASMQGDIVLTAKHAIASHTDNDFWIADDDTWFAAGKSRPSPIKTVIEIATGNNLSPVIFLGATNIMDLDERCNAWRKMGVTVITDITEIPE